MVYDIFYDYSMLLMLLVFVVVAITVYRVFFSLRRNFRPFTIANIFAPVWIRTETVMFKERLLETVLNSPADSEGERGGN